jgi:hypothetical protein
MGQLAFICPDRNQEARTEIYTSAETLARAGSTTMHLNCPLCGRVHEVKTENAYVYCNQEPFGSHRIRVAREESRASM